MFFGWLFKYVGAYPLCETSKVRSYYCQNRRETEIRSQEAINPLAMTGQVRMIKGRLLLSGLVLSGQSISGPVNPQVVLIERTHSDNK